MPISIINFSVNRDKIQFNEKGWANLTMFVDTETDNYGNNVSSIVAQTKEEREAKAPRTYVGNGKVVFTEGQIVVAEKKEPQLSTNEQSMAGRETPDLPF